MATLYVRNVPSEVYADLQAWAEENGRSVNAEMLALLERECAARKARSGWLDEIVRRSERLGLTRDDAALAIQAIREHRDAGL